MPKFRKKPVVIEAFQLTKEMRISNNDWPQWMHLAWQLDRDEVGSLSPFEEWTGDGALRIFTLEGIHRVDFGDYIIRGIKGEIYPCKPDIFQETYEPAVISRPTIAELESILESEGQSHVHLTPSGSLELS